MTIYKKYTSVLYWPTKKPIYLQKTFEYLENSCPWLKCDRAVTQAPPLHLRYRHTHVTNVNLICSQAWGGADFNRKPSSYKFHRSLFHRRRTDATDGRSGEGLLSSPDKKRLRDSRIKVATENRNSVKMNESRKSLNQVWALYGLAVCRGFRRSYA